MINEIWVRERLATLEIEREKLKTENAQLEALIEKQSRKIEILQLALEVWKR